MCLLDVTVDNVSYFQIISTSYQEKVSQVWKRICEFETTTSSLFHQKIGIWRRFRIHLNRERETGSIKHIPAASHHRQYFIAWIISR